MYFSESIWYTNMYILAHECTAIQNTARAGCKWVSPCAILKYIADNVPHSGVKSRPRIKALSMEILKVIVKEKRPVYKVSANTGVCRMQWSDWQNNHKRLLVIVENEQRTYAVSARNVLTAARRSSIDTPPTPMNVASTYDFRRTGKAGLSRRWRLRGEWRLTSHTLCQYRATLCREEDGRTYWIVREIFPRAPI